MYATMICWAQPFVAIQNLNISPTWEEWCSSQARRIARQRQFGELPFNDRELAHLLFVRWLYQTGRITS